MDYSILNASGELSPLQFLHIHIAVCLKKKQVGRKSWIYLTLKHYTINKSFKKCVFYRKTKTLCDPHVHGHVPQWISFLLNALVATAPVVVWTVDNAVHCINVYPVDNGIFMWTQLHVGKVDNTIHWILIFTQWTTQLVFVILFHWTVIYLAPVVQKVDNAIQWINLYSLDSAVGFPNTYPLDSDLSGG